MPSLDLSPPVRKILVDYADLFGSPPYDPRETLMGFGFACGPGWLPLIRGLLANLRFIVETDGLEHLRVTQVKEKFGQLRVYTNLGNDNVWGLLLRAESASGQICEGCGAPSEVASRGGWLTTLCPVCLRAPDVPAHWREEQGEVAPSGLRSPGEPTTLSVATIREALAGLDPAVLVALEGPREAEHRPLRAVEVVRAAADPSRFARVLPPWRGPGFDERIAALIRPEPWRT